MKILSIALTAMQPTECEFFCELLCFETVETFLLFLLCVASCVEVLCV